MVYFVSLVLVVIYSLPQMFSFFNAVIQMVLRGFIFPIDLHRLLYTSGNIHINKFLLFLNFFLRMIMQ